MNDLEKLCAVQIVISDLEKQLRPTATGHIHTLRDYAGSLKESVNAKLESTNELRV